MTLAVSYVYAYFDPSTKQPFYIGKGKGRRMYYHLQEAKKDTSLDTNFHKLRKIRKILSSGLEPEVKVIDSGLTDDDAFELEEFMIGWLGRRDIGTGCLTNLSDGGEGGRGICHVGELNPNYGKRGEDSIWWGRTHSEETKEKIRAAQVGKNLTEEHKVAIRKPKSEAGRAAIAEAQRKLRASGYRQSDEANKKRSETLKGRPSPMKGKTFTDEQKQRMSVQRKGIPKPKKLCQNCGREVAVNTFNRWHGDNCKELAHAKS